jgi:hypothetical protein
MGTRRTPLLLCSFAVLVALLAVTACSGGRSAGPHPSPTANASFIASAAAICARAREQLDVVPDFPFQHFDPLHPNSGVLPKVGRFFTGPGNELPILRRLNKQLYELGNPAIDRTGWRNVVGAIREFITVFEQEDEAALAADVPAWVKSVRLNRLAHKRLADATNAFAASGCDVL